MNDEDAKREGWTVKDDAALVEEALASGPEAFTPIIERYKDAVFGVALARLRNFHDAEDTTQQAFIEAYERLDRLKDPSRLGAWLRSIAIHRSLNHLRGRGRFVNIEDIEESAEDGLTPQVELERHELRERVMAAIGRLSKVQRETVTLFYISGYALQEIAAIQEVPVGTIKYRLHEARNRLKKELMDMVEEVLKDGAPRKDFAARVFELLCAYPNRTGGRLWRRATMDELAEIGPPGLDGFTRALDLPHWRTRRAAVHYLGWARAYKKEALPAETAVDLLKKALSDSNRRVRAQAVLTLLTLNFPDERKRRELVPLLVPLLTDRSRKVRFLVAGRLSAPDCAADVPMDEAIRVLKNERDPAVHHRLELLLLEILKTYVKKT